MAESGSGSSFWTLVGHVTNKVNKMINRKKVLTAYFFQEKKESLPCLLTLLDTKLEARMTQASCMGFTEQCSDPSVLSPTAV